VFEIAQGLYSQGAVIMGMGPDVGGQGLFAGEISTSTRDRYKSESSLQARKNRGLSKDKSR
jgi:hypothetical protein